MSRSATLFRIGRFALVVVAAAAVFAAPLHARTDGDPVAQPAAEPAELTMRVGDEVEVRTTGVTRSPARRWGMCPIRRWRGASRRSRGAYVFPMRIPGCGRRGRCRGPVS